MSAYFCYLMLHRVTAWMLTLSSASVSNRLVAFTTSWNRSLSLAMLAYLYFSSQLASLSLFLFVIVNSDYSLFLCVTFPISSFLFFPHTFRAFRFVSFPFFSFKFFMFLFDAFLFFTLPYYRSRKFKVDCLIFRLRSDVVLG